MPSGSAAPAARRDASSLARALLRLARWENALISAAGVLVGALWIGAPTVDTAWAAIAAVGLTVLANADNDATDAAVDRVAHPSRPIPAGGASLAAALALATAGAALGVAASAIVSWRLATVSALVCVAMLLYNRVLKRQPLVGNVAVALLASLPFLYGAYSVGNATAALPLIAFGVPLHLAREIAKDVDDVAGDALDRRTLPMAIGAGRSRLIASAAVALFVATAIVYCARGGRWTLLAALVPSFAATVAAVLRLRRGGPGAPALLKGAMLCAMAGALTERALR